MFPANYAIIEMVWQKVASCFEFVTLKFSSMPLCILRFSWNNKVLFLLVASGLLRLRKMENKVFDIHRLAAKSVNQVKAQTHWPPDTGASHVEGKTTSTYCNLIRTGFLCFSSYLIHSFTQLHIYTFTQSPNYPITFFQSSIRFYPISGISSKKIRATLRPPGLFYINDFLLRFFVE